MIIHHEGDRVTLKANAEEGWPEEKATILEDVDDEDDTTVVQVDDEFLEDGMDDGLREITIDQIEEKL